MTEAELIAFVRMVLGEPDQTILPDAIIQHFIDIWKVLYPIDTELCKLTYYVTISCAKYIIQQMGQNGKTGGASLREKDGQREIEEKFSAGGSPVDFWKKWLEDFLANPSDYLPCMKEGGVSKAMPIVTGVDRSKYIDVISNSNNLGNGYRMRSQWGTYENREIGFATDRDSFGNYRGK